MEENGEGYWRRSQRLADSELNACVPSELEKWDSPSKLEDDHLIVKRRLLRSAVM